jgi:D-3-phosphoglycerate dehydrogenase
MSSKPQAARVAIVGANFRNFDPERLVLASAGATVIDGSGLGVADALALCRDADAVMSDYFDWSASALGELLRCRVVCQYGVGLDQIDIAAASAAGILITHTPDYCVEELAEHTLALILAVARNVARFDRSVRAGKWDFNIAGRMDRLAGRTLGLVGFGRVARGVAMRARALGLRVVATDPYQDEAAIRHADVEPASLEQLLRTADIISLHAALTETTRHLIGGPQLRAVKRGVLLVNTARGGLVDQSALADAIEDGRVAGAGLDVLEQEPPLADERLLAFDNVTFTPHAGFLSAQSLAAVQLEAAEEVKRVLAGEQPRHAANAHAVVNDRTACSSATRAAPD